MAKNVFRPTEVTQLSSGRIVLDTPFKEQKPVEVPVPAEEYTGPTADDLRREAEAFRAQWEEEKAGMIASAQEEAENIVKEAEERAFQVLKAKTDEGEKLKQEAEDNAAEIESEAEARRDEILKEANDQLEQIRKDAYAEGFESGREEGYQEGRGEVERLVTHLHGIISSAIEKRTEIIEESETQVINLVLLIAKKVIKVISENQKNVVINNVIQALRKLKSRGDVILRVNLEDVDLTTDHVKDFMRMVENVRSITVMEDSRVDRGGCIIETDFGEIDARIKSQFNEIEEKILEMAPIREKGEA
ncbi:flagellar assembly protein FliH [Marispirochaeta aestuarii]|uniref:flagellar assembly protein FliH n=1 Tax=Marispirochaeta aestuarii TaxID=1963862 RepID=UPI0029C91C91|nr:flagellar assembly protein FliH [Marispirochaeta aestuarii]